MNEVGFSQVQGQLVTRTNASSKGAETAHQSKDGKELPVTAEKAENTPVQDKPKAEAEPADSLENVVASVNDYVQSIQRDLHFSVDKELEKTIVKVVDADSGELIRQIPEDIFLELARNLKQNGELQLVSAHG